MAGRRRRHTPLGAPGQPPGGRGWSADTWGYVVALVVTAIGVSLGIALIMTGASARERGTGWILVIETPLVGIAVIALSRWIQRLATSGRVASRREPGTWWARWAWVDLAIEIAVVAAVLMNLPA
jgi:hypothetical protein